MTKEEARKQMKLLRGALSADVRKQKDAAIREAVLRFIKEQDTLWFYSFVSYRTEVDTMELIRIVLEEGRMRVAVPKVVGKEMEFYVIHSMDDLRPGYQGIPEPVTGECVIAGDGVMLLPGLAFDRKKNRVGYGGGFYDRYLEKYDSQNLITAAAAYDFQVTEQITAEQFDYKPQWIITDKEIF